MADYHTFIDTVTYEKASAIARYQRRFKKLTKLLQLLQILFLLAIISWSSTRIPHAVKTVKLSGKYVAQISLYLLNPHVIFLIGNAIVLALYVLSRHIDVGNVSAASDFHEDYEKREPIAAAEPPPEELIDGEEEMQIVCNENLNLNLIGETESVVVEKAPAPAPAPASAPVIQKQLERTMSEKMKPAKKKKFRRSETEVRRVLATTCRRRDLRTFETVDTLSNEDFRLTVEAFIKKQQKFLRQQRMAEIEY